MKKLLLVLMFAIGFAQQATAGVYEMIEDLYCINAAVEQMREQEEEPMRKEKQEQMRKKIQKWQQQEQKKKEIFTAFWTPIIGQMHSQYLQRQKTTKEILAACVYNTVRSPFDSSFNIIQYKKNREMNKE